jgi:hypothetical protein
MIKESFTIQTNAAEGEWLVQMLLKLLFQILKPIIFKKSSDFETNLDDFELFWYSKPIHTLKDLIIRYCNLFSSKLYLISIIL